MVIVPRNQIFIFQNITLCTLMIATHTKNMIMVFISNKTEENAHTANIA